MLLVIDGIDASGKSTICRKISEKWPARAIGEFSENPLGTLITQIIEERRFFRLSDDFTTPFADLFCVLADTCLKYEGASASEADDVCIMERGIFSAVAYQFARACEFHSFGELETLHDAIMQVLLGQTTAVKRATHINLMLSEEALVDRVISRGEAALTSSEVNKLLEIQGWISHLSMAYGAMTLNVSQLSIDDVIGEIEKKTGFSE